MPVIGKGTYGCVHKPSMKCTIPKVNYRNKISKLMTKTNANSEIKEYAKISNADKQSDFFPGVPLQCEADTKLKTNIEAFQQCGININTRNAILVMEDGGIDLTNYAKNVSHMEINAKNKKKIKDFWVEAYRVLRGLKLFLDHGLVHRDIKPDNIVYNEKLNRINIIDFGLLKTVDNIVNECKNHEYDFPIFHWNFPPETILYNGVTSLIFSEFFDIMKIKRQVTKIYNNTKSLPTDEKKIVIKHIKESLFSNYNTITVLAEKKTDEFLDRSIETFDIYGTGISFMAVLQDSRKLLDPGLFNDFEVLFSKMMAVPLFERIQIDELMSEYNYILLRHNLMHSLKEVPNEIVKLHKKIEIVEKNYKPPSPKMMEELIHAEPIPICFNNNEIVGQHCKKPCQDGEERNPITERCVNKCLVGKERNPKTGRCVKTKKIYKSSSRKIIPIGSNNSNSMSQPYENPCSKEKERNQITGRCIKKCIDGQERNPKTGRCVKTKKNIFR